MIVININKAKNIGHDIRRKKREEEFAPYDKVIAAQIPGNSPVEAEAARQQIREKYSIIQTEIDSSTTPEEIKQALGIN